MNSHFSERRQKLISEGAVILVPDGAIYYCLDHQLFFKNKPAMKLHTSNPCHGKTGRIQCPKCLNFFDTHHEFDLHVGLVARKHSFPYPTKDVRIEPNGRIAGGEEAEIKVVDQPLNAGSNVGGGEDEGSGGQSRVAKVLIVNLSSVQGMKPVVGELA